MLRNIRIFILLYYYYNALDKHGIKPVMEKLKMKKLKCKRDKVDITIEEVVSFCNKLESVRIKHPLKDKALCLHKSVVAYSMLVERGINVDLLVGIAKGEFEAHSWIEFKGRVLNDNHDYVKQKYKIIMGI